MIREPGDPQSGPSRGEIENLCLLSAIPDNGCALSELPTRLGLSPLLVEPVAEAIGQLIDAGWIHELDGGVRVTSEGRAWLKEQLSGIE
jgi:predicted transcriptional regulator